MEPSFTFFDHTADMGITIRAPSLSQLLAPAGEALYAAIGQLIAGGDSQALTLELSGSSYADLLRDYLGELLILFERDHRIVLRVQVLTYCDKRLSATLFTKAIDNKRSVFHREVKAVTYHELQVQEISGGYQATVILDI